MTPTTLLSALRNMRLHQARYTGLMFKFNRDNEGFGIDSSPTHIDPQPPSVNMLHISLPCHIEGNTTITVPKTFTKCPVTALLLGTSVCMVQVSFYGSSQGSRRLRFELYPANNPSTTKASQEVNKCWRYLLEHNMAASASIAALHNTRGVVTSPWRNWRQTQVITQSSVWLQLQSEH